jgi:hypothetical protein
VCHCPAEQAVAAPVVAVSAADACRDLLRLLAGVFDGRRLRGRDHPAAVVLTLAAAAAVAGMKGYTAIAGWVADVPAAIVADLYLRAGAAPAGRLSRSTIWRVCTDADPTALDTAIGAWLSAELAGGTTGDDLAGGQDRGEASAAARVQLRLDGETVRGAKNADGDRR